MEIKLTKMLDGSNAGKFITVIDFGKVFVSEYMDFNSVISEIISKCKDKQFEIASVMTETVI